MMHRPSSIEMLPAPAGRVQSNTAAHLLALSEQLACVQSAIGEALHHGLDAFQSEAPWGTHRDALSRGLMAVQASTRALAETGDLVCNPAKSDGKISTSRPRARIAKLLSSPGASHWLKAALSAALARDPVDAAGDAEVLADLLDLHAQAALREAVRGAATGPAAAH
ncbi:hypothetical protein [Variovorax gossypii]